MEENEQLQASKDAGHGRRCGAQCKPVLCATCKLRKVMFQCTIVAEFSLFSLNQTRTVNSSGILLADAMVDRISLLRCQCLN
jgi:hypothetical protein